MNLFTASNQWATRPDDERFWTVKEAHDACKAYRETAREAKQVPFSSLRVEAVNSELKLIGKKETPARLTNWAFGQLSQRAGAPAGYLRTLPATLAAQNINHGLAHKTDGTANLLLHTNGGWLVRAFLSDDYRRIWNYEVLSRCEGLVDEGWKVPPARPAFGGSHNVRPATEADVLENNEGGWGLSVNVGDLIAPAGVYASDHDCFVFLVNTSKRIQDGTEGGLSRGVFITNSEVGAASLRITRFFFRHVCGNHIVWDASKVVDLRLRHVGRARGKFVRAFQAEVQWVDDASASDEEAKIRAAQRFIIADTKENVLDQLFGKKALGLSRKSIESAYELAEDHHEDGDPRSAWGIAQGLTRLSQQTPYQDERDRLDRAAGKVIQVAF